MKLPPDVAILMTLRDGDPERRGMRIRVLFHAVRGKVSVDWLRFNRILPSLQVKALVATIGKDPFPVDKGTARLWVITDAGRQFLDEHSAKETPRT